MAQPKRKEPETTPSSPEAVKNTGASTPLAPSAGLSAKGWALLAGVLLLANLPVIHRFVLRGDQPAPVAIPFADAFTEAGTVETNYWSTGGHWRVVNGQLLSPGVKNNPLWLKAKLPRDVVVEFDARSESPEGDIKVEIFGDGLNHASGYILIHGGWNNSVSIIARLDEHGEPLGRLEQKARQIAQEQSLPKADVVATGVFKKDTQMRVEAAPFPVQVGRTYRWRLERKGSTLRWLIDGQPFMSFDDPFPLEGDEHNRFGFSSWEAQLYFDNLSIQPL